MRLVHIINPVKAPPSSDLNVAQPVTFETLRRARRFSEKTASVQLLSAQYQEDIDMVPDDFIKTQNLKRSLRDLIHEKEAKRLPLIKDIIQRVYDNGDSGDYIIYSNVDIAVQPYFYEFIITQIKRGYDAFVINRRTIPEKFGKLEDIPIMYSCMGDPHPGYDCFVFDRNYYPEFILENICIGIQYVGLVLYVNLKLIAKNFKEFNKEHITFHIGNDKSWKERPSFYKEHNEREFHKIINKLKINYNNVESVINDAFPLINLNNIEAIAKVKSG